VSDAFGGFDWDAGNRAKCAKHGVSFAEIEALFMGGTLAVRPDLAHSAAEERFQAIGRTAAGRAVFVVFTLRERGGRRLVRAISARFMHAKEIKGLEEDNPPLRER